VPLPRTPSKLNNVNFSITQKRLTIGRYSKSM